MGHIHKGTLYDEEMQKVADQLLEQHKIPPPIPRVIIGMTTTPKRIPHIRLAIEALLRQTISVDVVLNVPQVFGDRRPHWRGKSARIPEWFEELGPRLHVHEPQYDWGPATKMLGTLDYVEKHNAAFFNSIGNDTIIVVTDDDQIWLDYAVAALLGAFVNTDSNYAWSFHGYDRDGICVGQGGDLLLGRLGNLRQLLPWGEELLEPAGRLKGCFLVDDLFFSAFMQFEGIPVHIAPWSRSMRRELLLKNRSSTACRRSCSPVALRLKWSS